MITFTQKRRCLLKEGIFKLIRHSLRIISLRNMFLRQRSNINELVHNKQQKYYASLFCIEVGTTAISAHKLSQITNSSEKQ